MCAGPPIGVEPTDTVFTTLSVCGSTRITESPWWFATQTAPGVTATPIGSMPTGTVCETRFVAGSILDTDPSAVFATHTDPKPIATSPPASPTGMVAAIGPPSDEAPLDPGCEPPPHAAQTVMAPTTTTITLRSLMTAIMRPRRYADRPCVR
jgi:hypothetical protein